MAVSTGSTALSSDMQGWYKSFNNFISSYASGIGTLTVPAANKIIAATDVNNLNTKISAFKSDTYLSTQSGWWTTGSVSSGAVIKPPTFITSTISNFSNVKCRNTATNSKGKHS